MTIDWAPEWAPLGSGDNVEQVFRSGHPEPIVSAVLSVLSCKARQIGGIAGNVEADEVLYIVVSALFRFIDRETVLRARGSCPIRVDYRVPSLHAMQKDEIVECVIHDARPSRAQLTLESAGFQLVHRSSAVRDWFNSDEVIRVYYEECKALARELTGASQAFTFDHLIREPGRQTGGGGLFKQDVVTTAERGGGYVSLVHMDYTDSSTWNEYLALHGISEPERASRIIVLNFWRPLFGTAERQPLALCDARTVHSDDLLEMMVYGYGHKGYSWHDIGISVYQVARSPEQQWYYYSNMVPDEVLLIKTYDSMGVIGRGCPHTSFTNNAALSSLPARRSIELRVLCYIDDQIPMGDQPDEATRGISVN